MESFLTIRERESTGSGWNPTSIDDRNEKCKIARESRRQSTNAIWTQSTRQAHDRGPCQRMIFARPSSNRIRLPFSASYLRFDQPAGGKTARKLSERCNRQDARHETHDARAWREAHVISTLPASPAMRKVLFCKSSLSKFLCFFS